MNKPDLRTILWKDKQSTLSKYLPIIFIVFINTLIWLPSIKIGFINDDYQILGWHSPKTLLECFKPFWTQDVSIYYWRPLTNSVHSILIWIWDFNPLASRILNLLLYIIVSLNIYYLLRIFNIKLIIALIFTIFFSVLTSHEINVIWIAGKGDLLAAIFILSFLVNYIKYFNKGNNIFLILSFLSFVLGTLSKETAFIIIFLPFILYVCYNIRMKIILIHNLILFIISLFIIVIRIVFLNIDIFNSPNVSNISILSSIINLIIYIPLSIISPDLLEQLYYLLKNNIIFIGLLILFSATILTSIYLFIKQGDKSDKRLALLGTMWFIIFIFPFLNLIMRWYVFIPGIGLILIFSAITNSIKLNYIKNLILSTVILVSIFSGLLISETLKSCIEVSNKTTEMLSSLKDYDLSNFNKLTIWALPDKINRINSLKNGTEQAVRYYSNNKKLNVITPLHVELSGKSKINLKISNPSHIELSVWDGRFIPFNGKSKSVIIDEDLYYENEFSVIKIITKSRESKTFSTAEVLIKFNSKDNFNLYFDGKIFKSM